MDNENTNSAVSNVDTAEQKATFDDVLADKEYQKEFDRRVSKALDTAKAKWDAEAEAKKSEAEKLANMQAEEKLQYELKKEQEKSANAIAELEAFKLKDEAIRIARDGNTPTELLDLIEFKGNNAENVRNQLDNINKIFNNAVNKALNDKLKQPAPTEHGGAEQTSEQAYLQQKYKNNPYFKG